MIWEFITAAVQAVSAAEVALDGQQPKVELGAKHIDNVSIVTLVEFDMSLTPDQMGVSRRRHQYLPVTIVA